MHGPTKSFNIHGSHKASKTYDFGPYLHLHVLTQHHHYPSSHPARNKSNSGLVASLYLQAWYRNWKSKDLEHSPDVFHIVMSLQGDRRMRFIWLNQRRFIRIGNPRISHYLNFTSSGSGVTLHVAKFAIIAIIAMQCEPRTTHFKEKIQT